MKTAYSLTALLVALHCACAIKCHIGTIFYSAKDGAEASREMKIVDDPLFESCLKTTRDCSEFVIKHICESKGKEIGRIVQYAAVMVPCKGPEMMGMLCSDKDLAFEPPQ
jgi:hypothetical protein